MAWNEKAIVTAVDKSQDNISWKTRFGKALSMREKWNENYKDILKLFDVFLYFVPWNQMIFFEECDKIYMNKRTT